MHLVDSERELLAVAASLAPARRVYLDAEFDSRREGTTLCVLQVADAERTHLLDALRLPSLAPLAPILGDPGREWVLHSGREDVALVLTALGLPAPPRVFDTQVAWALLGAEHAVSLSYLRYRVLGVRSDKTHQADDWRKRPLPPSQLAYAASDVADLPRLHAELGARLAERERAHVVHAASLECVLPEPAEREPLTLASFRHAWQLGPEALSALAWLATWHNELDDHARRLAPEARVFVDIARRLPRTAAELGRMRGVPPAFVAREGQGFVAGLARAASRSGSSSHAPLEPPAYGSFEEIRVDGWLAHARGEISADLGIAPDLAFPARLLRRMRRRILETKKRASGAELLEGWRAEILATPYLQFAERT